MLNIAEKSVSLISSADNPFSKVSPEDAKKFITPAELCAMLEKAGLDPVDRTGFVFNPVAWSWSLSERDLSVNYVTTSLRR